MERRERRWNPWPQLPVLRERSPTCSAHGFRAPSGRQVGQALRVGLRRIGVSPVQVSVVLWGRRSKQTSRAKDVTTSRKIKSNMKKRAVDLGILPGCVLCQLDSKQQWWGVHSVCHSNRPLGHKSPDPAQAEEFVRSLPEACSHRFVPFRIHPS